MNEFEIFSGGDFIKTDHPISIMNPFNGEVVAQTYLAGRAELEQSIKKAQDTELILKALPSFSKYKSLMQIAEIIEKEKDVFAKILCLESAKPIRYSMAETERAIQTFLVAAEEAKRLPGEYFRLDWTPAGAGKEALVKYFPVGLIAGISPFNFPLNLAVHKIAPAIAAGCPIILKPSSLTPLSTLLLSKVISKTELPKGAVSILPMDRQTGNLLVTDDRIKLISFTGSPEVGWKMKKDAGKKKVVLELGGNAAVIITESAETDLAVTKCLVGGFSYSGQVCIHAQRIYVQEKVFPEFSEKFIHAVKKLKPGNPVDPDTEISSMIDTDNASRIEQWVSEAVKEGAKVLAGGDREGSYYPPTVLTNTKKDMKVCALEVFGPVVILEPYSEFDKVLESVNESRYGLQAGVFTNNLLQMNSAFERLEVGGVIINDVPTYRADHMPYGGIKDSGLGREGVKYAILEMMEPKILVKNF